jgi:hypothetical protein
MHWVVQSKRQAQTDILQIIRMVILAEAIIWCCLLGLQSTVNNDHSFPTFLTCTAFCCTSLAVGNKSPTGAVTSMSCTLKLSIMAPCNVGVKISLSNCGDGLQMLKNHVPFMWLPFICSTRQGWSLCMIGWAAQTLTTERNIFSVVVH